MLFSLVLQQPFPNDSGPIYQETIAGRFPVEPYNTFSNLIFMVILIYFTIKIYKNPKQHLFFCVALPIIFASWIGGTMYHATRSHEFWLLLDWLPIMVVCVIGIIHFIGKLFEKWSYRLLLFFGLIALNFTIRNITFPKGFNISIGYIVTAVSVLLPFFWYAKKTNWRNVNYLLLGVILFAIAVTLRTLDFSVKLLPMGSHWLWHLFGGFAVFSLLYYIYKDDKLSA